MLIISKRANNNHKEQMILRIDNKTRTHKASLFFCLGDYEESLLLPRLRWTLKRFSTISVLVYVVLFVKTYSRTQNSSRVSMISVYNAWNVSTKQVMVETQSNVRIATLLAQCPIVAI